VLHYASQAAGQTQTTTLWGGTTGPELRCSGPVQSPWPSAGNLDSPGAYQQERFCQRWRSARSLFQPGAPGDLIFFADHNAAPMWGCIWAKALSAQPQEAKACHKRAGGDQLAAPTVAISGASHYRSELTRSRPVCAAMTAQPIP